MPVISVAVEYLATAADCVLVLWFMTSYFKAKRKIRWWEYLIWFSLFFINGQFMGDYYDFQSVMMVVLVFLYALIYLKGKWITKLTGDLGLYILVALINVGVIQLVAIVTQTPVESLIIAGSVLRILVLCISKITLVAVVYFVEKSLDGREYLKKEERILMIVLYGIFFIAAVISVQIIATIELSHMNQMKFLIMTLLLFLANIFLFYLIRKMNRQNQYELENGILKVCLEQQERQIYDTEKLYQEARKIRHDMKHYFSTYLQLLKDGETEVVIEDMQKIMQTQFETSNIFYVESKMINAVINQKALVCKEYGIPFEVQITGSYQWENESNLAILLSNLLDNAIEAEKVLDRKREIFLQIFEYKEDTNILVKNYIETSVLEKNPNLKTTKKNKNGHGIGMESIREIVRQEEGTLDISEEEHYFVVHILMPKR